MAGLVRRPRWLAATALAVAGWPLHIAALTVAPLTVVQPSLALGLVLLLWLGVRLLGEPARARDLGAVAVIGLGLALLAWGAPERGTTRPGTAAVALVVLGAIAAVPWIGRRHVPAPALVAAAGAGYAASGIATKLVADSGLGLAGLGWAAATAAVADARVAR